MKKKLFFLMMCMSQIVFSSQINLKKNKKVAFLSDDDDSSFNTSNALERFHPSKNDGNQTLLSTAVLNDDSSVKPYSKKYFNLTDLFENDIDKFFSSIDRANEKSLKDFFINIMNHKIDIKTPLREKILNMIFLELDTTLEEEVLDLVKNDQDKKYAKSLFQKKEEKLPFDSSRYSTRYLIKEFSDYFENKDSQKIKEQILSLNIPWIDLNDDLPKMLKTFFTWDTFTGLPKYSSELDKVVQKFIDSSFLSIENLNKAELKKFLTLFVQYNCFYGIKKIIDSNTFKNFSSEDIANILIFIVNRYKDDQDKFYYEFRKFLSWASTTKSKEKTNDLVYNEVILKLFYLKGNAKEVVKLFVNNFKDTSYREPTKDKNMALLLLFVLAKLDSRYIPILIEASKYYEDKNFLYHYISVGFDQVYDDGQTFLSTLVLKSFFNDSKETLIKLLNFSLICKDKPLVRSIFYNTLSKFFEDVAYKKQMRNSIDQYVQFIQKLFENENAIEIEQKNFMNELRAIDSIQDNLSKLSLVDNAFYDAYLEYLKGSKQDLRNLVFPVSKGIYTLAPEKDSQSQAFTIIRNSLKKIFREDRIKYLLFDLVETEIQKQSALDLLNFMGLVNKASNAAVASNSGSV